MVGSGGLRNPFRGDPGGRFLGFRLGSRAESRGGAFGCQSGIPVSSRRGEGTVLGDIVVWLRGGSLGCTQP